ncbi:MAG: PEGA domain-containing protein [Phycisphaerae bacterium]
MGLLKLGAGVLLMLSVCVGGCATVTRGTNEVLVVESDPPGAKVELSNGMSGTTPTTFKLSRRSNLTVKIYRDGHEPLEVRVNSQVAPGGAAAMAGNVLLGGIIGAGVDALTGSTLQLMPNPISVKLVPLYGNQGGYRDSYRASQTPPPRY